MKPGPKVMPKATKLARNTVQPVREAGTVQVVEPTKLPQQPDWLTGAGLQVWRDNIGRVSSVNGATEVDSELFANFCNLQGAIAATWRAGHDPKVTMLMEARKLMELLRIAGPASRTTAAGDNGKTSANRFARNGRNT